MKIKRETKKTEVFKVGDKEFLTKEKADKYLKEIEKEEKLKYFVVTHNFDATEGRGYYGQTFVTCLNSCYQGEENIVKYFCQQKFGEEFKKWYQDHFYINWIVREIKNKEEFLTIKNKTVEDNYRKSLFEVLISPEKIGDNEDNLTIPQITKKEFGNKIKKI